MDDIVGSGYEKLRIGTKLYTNEVTAIFKNGKLITSYPSFPKTIPIGAP